MLRAKRLPYKLIKQGWVVIQVGCPWDLLKAGQFRGIYFSMFVGQSCQRTNDSEKGGLTFNSGEGLTVQEEVGFYI